MVLNSTNQSEQAIDVETLEKMKLALNYLIPRHSSAKNISGLTYELFLHDETRIEYNLTDVEKLNKFLHLVYHYREGFPKLIQNLAFESMTTTKISNRMIGPINHEQNRTYINHKEKKISCIVHSKNLFIEENLLFAKILLGIYSLANRFLEEKPYQSQNVANPEKYEKLLQEIIKFTRFLLKDRLVSKLVRYYLITHNASGKFERNLISRVKSRKIKPQYFWLLQLIKEWKNFDWLLDQPLNSLRKQLTEHFDLSTPEKIYEMWIFYKILDIFGARQIRQKGRYINEKNVIAIQYQQQLPLDWTKEINGYGKYVFRKPDIILEKNHKIVAVVDAKYMKYEEESDEISEREIYSHRDILNQMIIYLDHSHRCDQAFVLYADEFESNVAYTQNTSRKILFLSCYPFSETSMKSFDKIRQFLQ